MLRAAREARQAQMNNALALLEFFEGRPVDPQTFFRAYYEVLWELRLAPNRNTMDEALSSGSLRLIRDVRVRTGLLGNVAVENGIRLVVANLDYDSDDFLKLLETAQSQVEALLQIIPTD